MTPAIQTLFPIQAQQCTASIRGATTTDPFPVIITGNIRVICIRGRDRYEISINRATRHHHYQYLDGIKLMIMDIMSLIPSHNRSAAPLKLFLVGLTCNAMVYWQINGQFLSRHASFRERRNPFLDTRCCTSCLPSSCLAATCQGPLMHRNKRQ